MRFPPEFLLGISKAANSPRKEHMSMSIIIQKPYIHLEKELRRAFEGEEDVKIIVDRRQGERRQNQQAIESERRQAGRRLSKEKLIEVLISP